MTEVEALALLSGAAELAARLATLVPELVANFQAIRDGLAETDNAALNDRIRGVHADVQTLDVQLQALRHAS